MTDPRLVSVVIAMRDGARFLADAVATVRAQAHRNVELIVVDDGSCDDSVAVAQSLPIDRLVALGTNQGVSTARNVGVALATGDLVTFLDVDDYMLPDKLVRQVAYLEAHPGCSCVLTHQRVVVDADVEVPHWLREHSEGLVEGPPLPISALIRVSALYGYGGFDPSFRTGEDMDLLFRLRRGGCGVATMPDVLVVRRIHGANATYATAQIDRDLVRAVRLLSARARPVVSVVLPTGGDDSNARHVVGSLESRGPGEAVEVIVVDDGSTGWSGELAQSSLASVTVVGQPRLGLGAARNHGVLMARGEYVAFVDDGESWHPATLEAQVAALAADPGLDGIRGPAPSAMTVRRQAFSRVGPFAAREDGNGWLDWCDRAVTAGLRFAEPGPSQIAR